MKKLNYFMLALVLLISTLSLGNVSAEPAEWYYGAALSIGVFKVKTDGTGFQVLDKIDNKRQAKIIGTSGEWIYYEKYGVKVIRRMGANGEFESITGSSDNGVSSICRIKTDGTGQEVLVRNTSCFGSSMLAGDWVYYGKYNNATKHYDFSRVKIDGTVDQTLGFISGFEDFIGVAGDSHYYYDKYDGSSSIFRLGPNGKQLMEPKVAKDSAVIKSDWIYYSKRDTDNNFYIYKMKTDGTYKSKLISRRDADIIYISDDFIYYCVYGKLSDDLFRCKLDGTNEIEFASFAWRTTTRLYNIKVVGDSIYYQHDQKSWEEIGDEQVRKIKPGETSYEEITNFKIDKPTLSSSSQEQSPSQQPSPTPSIQSTPTPSPVTPAPASPSQNNGLSTGDSSSTGSRQTVVNSEWFYGAAAKVGVFKVKPDGSEFTVLYGFNDKKSARIVEVSGDWIYYTTTGTNHNAICKVKNDGTGQMVLALSDSGKDSFYDITLADGRIYYELNTEHYSVKTDGTDKRTLDFLKGTILAAVADDWIYYEQGKDVKIGDDSYLWRTSIYRIKTNGTGKQQLESGYSLIATIVKQSDAIKNGWIYYRLNNDDSSYSLYRMKIDGSSKTKLPFNEILYISSEWIYYSNNKTTYKSKLDGTGETKLGSNLTKKILDRSLSSNNCILLGDNFYYQDRNTEGEDVYNIKADGNSSSVKITNFGTNAGGNSGGGSSGSGSSSGSNGGQASQLCNVCVGEGKVNCFLCHGSGNTVTGDFGIAAYVTETSCRRCQGKGTETCPGCKGTGRKS